MTNFLRPDELATESEIKKSRGRSEDLRSGLQTGASFAAPVAGKAILSKLAPFLSPYLPEDISMKGINKMFPKVGNFLKNGINQGLSLKSGLDFLRNEMENEEIKKKSTQNDRNIIEQYSPELHQFIKDEIGRGRHPLEAGARARIDKKHESVIKKIEKDHKTDWSSILESVYGGAQQANPKAEQQMPQQGQQQPGQGQQALMAILQQIKQKRGG